MNYRGTTNSRAAWGGPHDSPAEKLRRQWQEGREPDLVAFAAQLPDLSPAELADLIRFDFDVRWRRNDRRRPEEYFQSFLAVAANTELAVDVIYDEYLAREQSGERPALAEYQQRFPAFAGVLTEQIQLHDALDSIDTDPQLEPDDRRESESQGNSPTTETSYEILEQIGTGGMGVVYKARQAGLNRFVALKMVRAIDADNPVALARFGSEARVVAALHHPNIVQVHDYGQNEGLPYIAMELIEGGSLADRLNGTPWPARTAAALLIKLASAIQFAHDRHVVHRDLKPANVLVVAESGGIEVKITDFGLAKFHVDESAASTRSFAFLGTPSYMAPEQASGPPRDIGPAADIYSLGAILYELLTGMPPYRGESPMETLRLVLTRDPVALKSLAPQVSRDLATICDKCLQRDPKRRYPSAAELCSDLTRYLEGKPIHARPVSKAEHAWRWCRRNPYLAGALSAVGMLLIGIAAVSIWYSTQLRGELAKTRIAKEAEHEANQSARQRLWDLYLSDASGRNASHNVGQRFAALQSIDKAIALLDTLGRTDERELQLRNAVLASIVLPDIREVRSLGEAPAGAYAYDLSVASDRYLITTEDGTLSGYRLSNRQRLWTIKASEPKPVPQLSPDGRLVAAQGKKGVQVWTVDAGEPQLIWEAGHAQFFRFLPDGKHAVYSIPAEEMRLVRAQDGTRVRTIGKGPAQSNFAYHTETNRLAVCGSDSVEVIALGTGELEAELPVGTYEGKIVAWHPGGEYLAVWEDDKGITLWNVKQRAKVLYVQHFGLPARLCFNEDGSQMASQSLWDRRLCVWDVGTGRRLLEVPEFLSAAYDIAADRRILFLTTRNGGVSLTELTAGACQALAQSLHTPLGYWNKVSLSPENRIAAFSSLEGFELWDVQTTQRLLVREIGPCSAEFDRDGGLFIACNTGIYHFSRNIDTQSSADEASLRPERRSIVRFANAERLTGPITPWTLGVNPSGQTLVFSDSEGWALQHRGHDRKIIRLRTKLDPRLSAVSSDNRFVTVANWNLGGARVWNAESGAYIKDLAVGCCGIMQFSPDGKLLAATPDGVTLWNTSDWRLARKLHARGTTPSGLSIAFSPDSRVLAVGQVNGVLSLFDPLKGNEWASLPLWDSGTSAVAFSADQQWLVASSIKEGSTAQVWDLAAMRSELRERGLDLPTDVLRPMPPSQYLEQSFEVVLDDRGVLDASSSPESGDSPATHDSCP
jgi:eukaryotic-like serine/threonine-protein kinase